MATAVEGIKITMYPNGDNSYKSITVQPSDEIWYSRNLSPISLAAGYPILGIALERAGEKIRLQNRFWDAESSYEIKRVCSHSLIR